MQLEDWQQEIWQWLAAVPRGRVASYGQLARLAGHPRHARHVGSILRRLPADSRLPWHRILRSSGELAFPAGSAAWERQRDRLEAEGVVLVGGRVNLARYGWKP